VQNSIQSYKDLIAWNKALALAIDVHRLSDSFPRSERFGLTTQLRRAAVSIPSNIAEGAARRTTRDLVAFLHIARGSLAELETQLLLAQQLGYADIKRFEQLRPELDEISRLINGLIKGLRQARDQTDRPRR
jgi:four helix bundle protein